MERTILNVLKEEMNSGTSGIYHKLQIDMAYNSNHIEGSRLSHDETRYIYETNTIMPTGDPIQVDDIMETINHFACFKTAIEKVEQPLSENIIKDFHKILKNNTADSRRDWFAVGDYKKVANYVGDKKTASPKSVNKKMAELLSEYNEKENISFDDILDFHVRFERIHPFQDGNGRVGRLIIFRECLRNNIVPFIVTDDMKYLYYRGLKEWDNEKGYLRDTCLSAQDKMKAYFDYFEIKYE